MFVIDRNKDIIMCSNQEEEKQQQATPIYQANESQNEVSEKKSNVRWGLLVVMILVGVLLGLFLAFYGDKIIWVLLSLIFVFSVIFRYFKS